MGQTGNSKTILVVDDDASLRDLTKEFLVESGYEVVEAENGKVAQGLVAAKHYDMIISDIKMPVMDGLELLHFIKETKLTPVILMTGFADILETQEAYEMGASDFVTKPFKKDELLKCVDKVFNPPPGSMSNLTPGLDNDYCKLNLDDFTSGSKAQADIYVRLSPKKYLKIAHKDQSLDPSRIEAYKQKGMTFLYMKKEDFCRYVGFNLQLSGAAQQDARVAPDKMLRLLKHTSDVILENARVNGIDKKGFQSAQSTVESTIALMSEDKNLYEMLSILNTHSDYLYSHSLGVSLYSTLLAKEAGWDNPSSLFKVSMGGLFHDIGKQEIPREILEKPRKNYTLEELKIYESHPARGRDILDAVPSVPSDVTYIVMYHHENAQGTGFPFHVKKDKLHPLAKLVHVADAFCSVALSSPQGPGRPPEKAIEKLLTFHLEDLDPYFLKLLMNIFKIPVSSQHVEHFKKNRVA